MLRKCLIRPPHLYAGRPSPKLPAARPSTHSRSRCPQLRSFPPRGFFAVLSLTERKTPTMSILRPNSIMATSGDNLTKPGLMTSVALGGASCVFTVNVSVRSQVRGDCPVVSRRAPIWAEGEAALLRLPVIYLCQRISYLSAPPLTPPIFLSSIPPPGQRNNNGIT